MNAMPTSWPRVFSVFGNGFLFLLGGVVLTFSPNDLDFIDKVAGVRATVLGLLVLFLCYLIGEMCHAIGQAAPLYGYPQKRVKRLVTVIELDNEAVTRAYKSANEAAEALSGLSLSLPSVFLGLVGIRLFDAEIIWAVGFACCAFVAFISLQFLSEKQMSFIDQLIDLISSQNSISK